MSNFGLTRLVKIKRNGLDIWRRRELGMKILLKGNVNLLAVTVFFLLQRVHHNVTNLPSKFQTVFKIDWKMHTCI